MVRPITGCPDGSHLANWEAGNKGKNRREATGSQ